MLLYVKQPVLPKSLGIDKIGVANICLTYDDLGMIVVPQVSGRTRVCYMDASVNESFQFLPLGHGNVVYKHGPFSSWEGLF